MSKLIEYYPYSEKISVIRWLRNGDHPNDRTVNRLTEGKVVGRLKAKASLESRKPCPLCNRLPKDHGLLKGHVDGERLVCPGDYIETVVKSKTEPKSGYRLHKRKQFERYFTKDPKK